MSNITLFAQMVSILPRDLFQKKVAEHKSDFASKGFDSWTHQISMLFLQIAKCESLRDIAFFKMTCRFSLGSFASLKLLLNSVSVLPFASTTSKQYNVTLQMSWPGSTMTSREINSLSRNFRSEIVPSRGSFLSRPSFLKMLRRSFLGHSLAITPAFLRFYARFFSHLEPFLLPKLRIVGWIDWLRLFFPSICGIENIKNCHQFFETKLSEIGNLWFFLICPNILFFALPVIW